MQKHDIGWVVDQLFAGKFVRRAGWNGKGMHIYLDQGETITIGDGVYKGEKRTTEPHVCLYTAHGTHQPGWVCSQADLLATDWELAEQE